MIADLGPIFRALTLIASVLVIVSAARIATMLHPVTETGPRLTIAVYDR